MTRWPPRPMMCGKLRIVARAARLSCLFVVVWLGRHADVIAAPVLTLARPVDQSRFRVTTFAEGLAFPTSMATLSDGSLLVATSVGATLFGSATGRLVRLVDANGDGIADGVPQELAGGSNLPGLVTSVRRVGNLVVALSSKAGSESITFWRTGATPTAAFTFAGRLSFTFPSGFEHTMYALAAREVPDAPSQVDVFFNIGAAANSVSTPLSSTVSVAGSGVSFQSASVVADSIHRVRVTDSGGTLDVSSPVQIARGLRNAAGLVFDGSGDLLLQDNGIDTEGNRGVSFSADELNRVSAGQIGQTVVDFGFANTYVRYSDGVLVNPTPTVTDPLVAFLPKDGRKSEGAVEIAVGPASFGQLSGGVFTAFFGKWGQAGVNNDENPVVYADPATGQYFHFVDSQLLGHPYGMMTTQDSLFITDLSYTGSLDSTVNGVTANQAGVIYQVMMVPEPGAIVSIAVGGTAIVMMNLSRRRIGRRPLA